MTLTSARLVRLMYTTSVLFWPAKREPFKPIEKFFSTLNIVLCWELMHWVGHYHSVCPIVLSSSSSPFDKHPPPSSQHKNNQLSDPCDSAAHCYIVHRVILAPEILSALLCSSSIKGGPKNLRLRWPTNCTQKQNQSVQTENTLFIKTEGWKMKSNKKSLA